MDNLRLILVFTLAFIVLLLWQAWNEDYGPKPEQETAVTQSEIGSGNPAASPPAIPSAEVAKPESVGKQLTGTLPGVDDSMGTVSGKIGVTTDLFTLEIDTRGGSILSLLLNEYPVSLEQKDVKFTLMRPTSPDLFVAQSGLIGLEKGEAPTHEAQYQSKEQHYSMGDKDSLVVELSWASP
ncbi:MAG TPA: membrane protein insertase YidC, partial [Gammaproteobacteria bacterium]|nr:membrane protein insertase YidC [Gammaproteobacteria bacterium]